MIALDCLGEKRAPPTVPLGGPHPRDPGRHHGVAGAEVADGGAVGEHGGKGAGR